MNSWILGGQFANRLGSHPGAVLEIVVGPDMNDVVERPDFGVKEGAERRHLDPFGQRLAEALFDFRHRSWLQPISPHLEDHRPAPSEVQRGHSIGAP